MSERREPCDLKAVKAVILDVDGVLTDGSVVIDSDGREIKRFHVRDGGAIRWLAKAGIHVAWLSGRQSGATAARAAALGVERVIQGTGHGDKLAAYGQLTQTLGVGDHEVCYMGDDLHDLAVMQRVGFAAAPADAVDEIKDVAHLVTRAPGGRGAVRELTEHLLKAQNRWDELLDGFRGKERSDP